MVPAIGNLNLTNPKIEEASSGSQARLTFDLLLVALSAALYTLALPPYDWSLLGWFALAPLFIVIRGKGIGRSIFYGLLFGVAICAGVAHWMYSAISSYFIALFPLNLILTILSFIIFVGVYTGVTAGGWSVLMRRSGGLRWLAIPALWVVCEFARSTFISGFSWGLLGYTQHRLPVVIQVADLTGIYGLSFLLVCSSLWVAEVIIAVREGMGTHRLRRHLALLAVALATTLAYGVVRLRQFQNSSERPKLRVALVEHAMPAQARWNRVNYVSSLLSYVQLTAAAITPNSVDLIIWPEFASGLYIDRDPSTQLELSRLVRTLYTPLLLGSPRTDDENHYYNSAYLIARDGTIADTYDKMRLLPFAEYHPLGFPGFVNRHSDVPEEFTPGARYTIFSIPHARFGLMICYEATYPEYARHLTLEGAQFLVNVSNDVWLAGVGGTAAASQHFAMAIFRAVENKRAMARATMAGITGFVDQLGRPYQLSQSADAVTSGYIATNNEITVYTRFGDWFVLLCAVYSAICLVAAIRETQSNA